MTAALESAVRPGGRELPKPPSILRTGFRLPEVRWATVALILFLAGWALQLAGAPAWTWWALYLICYAAGGWEPALAGLQALREKTLDVDLLMIVAAIAAASIGQVFDGALLIVIFATSGALEAIVTQRTADSVSSLLTLTPEQATVLDESGGDRVVDTDTLDVGDVILVRPGERIGADGTIVDGRSEVDQQAITGESVPVVRGVGDDVLSGTVNGTGALQVRVTSAPADSVIARIVSLVEEASATKAKTQLFIEKVEQRYSLGVVVATLVVFGLPLLAFGDSLESALLRAITFMIVASPCAVVLSTMPPLLASIANAGRHGVLVKSSTIMESLGRTTLVAFDKTGTLTEGAPEVSDLNPSAGASVEVLLAQAAAVEQYSEHPLGRAIVRAATAHGIRIPHATDVRALPGLGVTGQVDSHTVKVTRGTAESGSIGTVVSVTHDGELLGSITLIDRVRPDAADAVRATEAVTGKPAHLLTGDNPGTAAHIARLTGIMHVHAELLPDQKSEIVTRLEAGGNHVMLVGDGVNDAPALASATTGVAMGRHGSDLALETADVVIVRDELGTIPRLIGISRRARRFVIANLIIAATFITVLITWTSSPHSPAPRGRGTRRVDRDRRTQWSPSLESESVAHELT